MRKLLALTLVLGSTAADAGAPPPTPSPAPAADAAALARSHREFAVDLYKKLTANKAGNQFVSPTSIAMALEMTRLGARGQTQEEMTKALHLDELKGSTTTAEGALTRYLGKLDNKDLTLSIANRLWAQKGVGWNKSYVKDVTTAFDGAIANVDYAAPETARKTINDWVETITHKRIVELLPVGSIDESTRLVLTNAIYFKGSWVTEFDKKETRKTIFHTAPKTVVNADFMVQTGTINGADVGGGVTIAELPYKGGDLAMDVIVPRLDTPVESLEQSLTTDQLDRWFQALRPQDGELFMPKWESGASYELNEPLNALGMRAAFTGGADFSGMGDVPLQISAVLHKSFVHVDEEGSEAAAATAVVMNADDAAAPGLYILADHPFLYVIRDTKSGEILFIGRVADPTAT
jgi:serpin B